MLVNQWNGIWDAKICRFDAIERVATGVKRAKGHHRSHGSGTGPETSKAALRFCLCR